MRRRKRGNSRDDGDDDEKDDSVSAAVHESFRSIIVAIRHQIKQKVSVPCTGRPLQSLLPLEEGTKRGDEFRGKREETTTGGALASLLAADERAASVQTLPTATSEPPRATRPQRHESETTSPRCVTSEKKKRKLKEKT